MFKSSLVILFIGLIQFSHSQLGPIIGGTVFNTAGDYTLSTTTPIVSSATFIGALALGNITIEVTGTTLTFNALSILSNVQFTTSGAGKVIFAGTTTINGITTFNGASGYTFSGALNVVSGGQANFVGSNTVNSLSNAGTIVIGASSALTINQSLVAGTINGAGNLAFANGASLTSTGASTISAAVVLPASVSVTTGSLTFQNSAVVQQSTVINGSVTFNSVLNIDNSLNQGYNVVFNGGPVAINQFLNIKTGAIVLVGATLTVAGTINAVYANTNIYASGSSSVVVSSGGVINTNATLGINATLSNQGTINVLFGGRLVVHDGSCTAAEISLVGTMEIQGAFPILGCTFPATGSGILIFNPQSSITYTLAADSSLNISTIVVAGLSNVRSGQSSATFNFNGNVNVSSGGTLQSASSGLIVNGLLTVNDASTLVISGSTNSYIRAKNVVLSSTGSLNITGAANASSQLRVDNAINIQGSLHITVDAAITNNYLAFLTFGSRTGTFASVTPANYTVGYGATFAVATTADISFTTTDLSNVTTTTTDGNGASSIIPATLSFIALLSFLSFM